MQYIHSENIYPTKEFIRNLLLLLNNEKDILVLYRFIKKKYSIMDGTAISCIDFYFTFLVRENGYLELQTCEYIFEKSSLSVRMPFSKKEELGDMKTTNKKEIAIEKIADILSSSKQAKEGRPDSFITFTRGILGICYNLQDLKILLEEYKKRKTFEIKKTVDKTLCNTFKSYLAYRILDFNRIKKEPFGMEIYALFLLISNNILPSAENRDKILKDIENNPIYKEEFKCLLHRRKIDSETKETNESFDLYTLDNCRLIDRLTPNLTDSMCVKVPPTKHPFPIILRKRLSYVDETFVGLFLCGCSIAIPDWIKKETPKEKEEQIKGKTEIEIILSKQKVSTKELELIHDCIGIKEHYNNKFDKLDIKKKHSKISELRWHIDALKKYISLLYSYRITYTNNKRWCDNCTMKVDRKNHKCV